MEKCVENSQNFLHTFDIVRGRYNYAQFPQLQE
jgi:hypothetical protein